MLPAPDAPFWWATRADGPALEGRAQRWRRGQSADFALSRAGAVRHIVVDDDGVEHVLVRTSDSAVTLSLKGARAFRAPVRITLQIRGFKHAAIDEQLLGRLPELISTPTRAIHRTQYQFTMRNALIAIDGEAARATYFEVAAAIFGEARPRQERREHKRSAKEVARRARAKGRQLRDGGYRDFIRGRVSAQATAVRHSKNA